MNSKAESGEGKEDEQMDFKYIKKDITKIPQKFIDQGLFTEGGLENLQKNERIEGFKPSKEYQEQLEEFGDAGFPDGLLFPCIPFISSLGIGITEARRYIDLIPKL